MTSLKHNKDSLKLGILEQMYKEIRSTVWRENDLLSLILRRSGLTITDIVECAKAAKKNRRASTLSGLAHYVIDQLLDPMGEIKITQMQQDLIQSVSAILNLKMEKL